MKQRAWIFVSGATWLGVGAMLLYKGIRFISQGLSDPGSICQLWSTPQQGGAVLLASGLLIGYLKGLFVLPKTVRRVVGRIRTLPEPVHFGQVYAKSYWILITGMVALGISLKFLPIAVDLRGAIDVAIGSALIRGSLLYFRVGMHYPAVHPHG